MTEKVSFKGCSLVSCGTLRGEIEHLQEDGFLDPDRVLYTAPGLHEWPRELEIQVARQLAAARDITHKVIVLYGEKCFIDTRDPSRVTETLIQENCPGATRLKASNCVDMLASKEHRDTIAGPDRVYWLTPGWLEHWSFIFKDWDAAKANETFPQHDKAILLDAIGFFEQYVAKFPERVLEISDWMKIPIEPYSVSLGRLKQLLVEALGPEREVK